MADAPLEHRITVRFETELSKALEAVADHRGLNTAGAIREAVWFYAALFGPCAGFVFLENRHFTIQFVNQPALQLLGYKFEELFGSSMIDLYDERTQQQFEVVNEFMAKGGVDDVRVSIRTKDGRVSPMRLFARREVQAIGIPRIYATWRDVLCSTTVVVAAGLSAALADEMAVALLASM